MMGIFKDEDSRNRENLSDSFRDYRMIVQKFGCYVAEVSQEAEKGCVMMEDLQKRAEYGSKVLRKLMELGNNMRQYNLVIEGDVEALLAEHKGYLERLQEIGARVASKKETPTSQPASRQKL